MIFSRNTRIIIIKKTDHLCQFRIPFIFYQKEIKNKKNQWGAYYKTKKVGLDSEMGAKSRNQWRKNTCKQETSRQRPQVFSGFFPKTHKNFAHNFSAAAS